MVLALVALIGVAPSALRSGEDVLRPRWTYDAGGCIFVTPTVVGDILIVAACSGTVVALNTVTGKPIWLFKTDRGAPSQFHADPVVRDDVIVFGSDDYRNGGHAYIYALNARSGELQWQHEVPSGVMADLVRSDSSLYAVTLDDELICLDIVTGRLRWKLHSAWRSGGKRLRTAPALSGDQLFFGSQEGIVYALSATSGVVLWKRTLGSPAQTNVTVANGNVYVGTEDSRIFRLHRATGEVLGTITVDGFLAGPLLTNEKGSIAFILTERANGYVQALVAIDPLLRSVRWSRDNDSQGWTSTRILDWQSDVVVGTAKGELVCFSQEDGTTQWRAVFDGMVRGTGRARNTLYIGTLGGRLYAYDRGGGSRHRR
jgi:eukaryotic-like serine/threonine-protein kinase